MTTINTNVLYNIEICVYVHMIYELRETVYYLNN